MLKLNYEKLKTFMEKLEDGHIFQGLKLHFLKIVQEPERVHLLTPQQNLKVNTYSKMTILAWVAHIQNFIIASRILQDNWVNTTSTYLVTNVAQHWDILAKKLQYGGNDPWDWQHFKKNSFLFLWAC